MNKWKYAHKSISFLWIPPNYPVKWVYNPDEVPIWDTSRGYPRWEQIPEDLDKLHDVKPPPDEGYPRLVRVPGSKEGSEDSSTHEHDDIIDQLAALYPDVCKWRDGKPVKKLMSDLLKLANRYGAPDRDGDNTLHSWLTLISWVQMSLQVLSVLEDVGYESTRDYVEGLNQELHDSRKVASTTQAEFDAATLGELGMVNGFRGAFLLHEGQFLFEGNSKDDWNRLAVKHFREYEANSLYTDFTKKFSHRDDAGRTPLHFEAHGIYVFSSIGEWASYKLSELWRGGNGVSVCPVCGSLFTSNHGNRKYCRSRSCAYKAFKQNQKTRAAQSEGS